MNLTLDERQELDLARTQAAAQRMQKPVTKSSDAWPRTYNATTASPHSDHANAHRIVASFGVNMLHVGGLGWHTWSSGPWVRDDMGVQRAAAALGCVVLAETSALSALAASEPEELKRAQLTNQVEERTKWAKRSESARTVADALGMAKPMLHIHADKIDSDPMLLACKNGTLDLRTGKLREHRLIDFLTQCTAAEYHENATAPVWEKFIGEVFNQDVELIEWTQRFLGYCLTGEVREHILLVATGGGGNGKSTLFEAFAGLLGTYAKTAPPGLLLAKKGERHPTTPSAKLLVI